MSSINLYKTILGGRKHMNTVHKTNKLTYKREEISERLSVLIELKNTLDYSVVELTEALGFRGDIVYKSLKSELPVTDEMYNRARALLELNKLQTVKGREQELRDRVFIAIEIQKTTGVDGLAKMIGLPKGYIENINIGKKLIGDHLFKDLVSILNNIRDKQEQKREEKRIARIFKISDVIDELIEEVNRLELLENIEDYYSEINSKKRAIKRLKELEDKGVKEVTPNGIGYMALR